MYRNIQGTSRSMLHAFVITGRPIAWMAYILCPVLVSATILGVSWLGSSFSNKYLLWPVRLAFCIVIFRFTIFVVQNLGYLLSLVSQTCPFQIAWVPVYTLYSCCLGSFPLIFFVQNFEGRSKVVGGNLWRFPDDLEWIFLPNLPRGICSCFWFLVSLVLRCLCACLVVLFSSLCLLLKGSPNF